MKKTEIIIFAIALFSFIVGIYFYPQMPEEIASHWNAQGQADGYMSKFWGLFLMPIIIFGLDLLFVAILKTDPLKENIEKSRKYYDGFIILFSVFMLFIYLWTIMWNTGIKINPNAIFPIGFGILFYYLGILCENVKRNWFIGIKTPWTLSSDKVWEKTHKVGGKLFKIAGIIAFAGALFQNYAFLFILVPAIFVAVYTIFYSYFEYKKEF